MAAPVTVRLEGEAEFQRTLKGAAHDLRDLTKAHQAAAAAVVPAARTRVPYRTGRLLATIRGAGSPEGATIQAGSTSVPYAGVQEYGWPRRNIPAQAYLVPAAEATQAAWLGAYQAEVEDILGHVRGV